MRAYQIDMPDSTTLTIEGPEDATDDELIGIAQEEFARRNVKVPTPVVSRPTSHLQGLREGIEEPANNIARWLERGADAVGLKEPIADLARAMGQPGTVDENIARREAEREYDPSDIGRIAGNAIGTLPALALPGGALAQGAATGAVLSGADTVGGLAKDTTIGAAAGKVGQKFFDALGGIISPIVQPAIQKLIDAGIPVTPGQIAGQGGIIGRGARAVEDALASVPFVGTAIRGAQDRGADALNRAATNRALKPIGEALPESVKTGHDAVAFAGDQLRAAYADVLPRLTGALDTTFQSRINAITSRAGQSETTRKLVADAKQELAVAFQAGGRNGAYNGRSLRDASDRLDKLASVWRTNRDDPYIREAGEIVGKMREQLHALARRQNPQQAQRLRDVDRGYASLVRVEKAAAGAEGGVFTPAQYRTATRMTDRSARRRQSARGQALDQDLSDAGAMVLSNRAGQGGSKDVNSLVAAAAGTAAAVSGNPYALAGVGAAATSPLLYSRPGVNALQWAMTGRQGPVANTLADLARAGRPVGVLGGAAAPSILFAKPE